MATRPERISLSEGTQAWDGEVDANFNMLINAPLPLHFEGSVLDLNTNFPAVNYDDCIVTVSGVLYISDGAVWSVYRLSAAVPDTTAVTVSEMATDFNTLLSALRTAGIMAT
jgi:hypothetical protein